MSYRIAGIDVHTKMLAVADVEVEGEFHFDRCKVGTSPAQLRALAEWLLERHVEEVVMESTAQYWRPVWEALKQHWRPDAARVRARRGSGARSSCPGAIESWTRRTQKGLPRCRAVGQTPSRAGTYLELRARRRATALAHRDATKVPSHTQSRATPESAGSAA